VSTLRTVCSWPGCPRPANARGRCSTHRHRPRTRALERERQQALKRSHGRCVTCGAPAVIVHHIVEREHGGSDLADNLEALCDEHHRAVHGYRPRNDPNPVQYRTSPYGIGPVIGPMPE
jgi:5-methylcytosine-specific restriction endonuclease McrA